MLTLRKKIQFKISGGSNLLVVAKLASNKAASDGPQVIPDWLEGRGFGGVDTLRLDTIAPSDLTDQEQGKQPI